MKKTNLRLDHLMTLIEEGRLKVGRYLFKRRVDALGNSYDDIHTAFVDAFNTELDKKEFPDVTEEQR